ncbi:MAG: lamin tail domain-containing protein [Candidatus Staskawiczbacteria bacterium]|jgi:competence ComEA-like helix-hairpin-helix protein
MFKKYTLLLFFILFFCLQVADILAISIDINNASLSQLDELAGIGPVKAQAIIDARPFSSVDDLNRVKGIGDSTLQKIKDQGFACVSCATSTEAAASQANTQTAISEEAPTPTPSPTTYSDGIYINELLPSPKGADDIDEWIELYNSNNFNVDLSGWQIQDTQGSPKTFTIPKDTNILANSFLVFKRPETKIMLNNDTDGINLLSPDGNIVDSASYPKASTGQSYNKTNNGWTFSKTLTPGAQNIITGATTLSKTKNSANNDLATIGLADISQSLATDQHKNIKSPWFLFFIVLIITIILAIITLFIKLRLGRKKETTFDD